MNDNTNLILQFKEVMLEQNTKQTEIITNRFNKEIDEIKSLLTKESEKVNKLEEEVSELRLRCKYLEKSQRINNIIIFNSNFHGGDILNFILTLLNSLLELNLTQNDINQTYKIGRGDNKPIIVKFISFLTKQKVLRNCKKLKNTSIRIAEELSKEERIVRKVLVDNLKIEKAKNKKAHIYGENLFVEGISYSYQDLTSQSKLNNNEVQELTVSEQLITGNHSKPDIKKIQEQKKIISQRDNKYKEKPETEEHILETTSKKVFAEGPAIRPSTRAGKNKQLT